jgi:hypothetical protein
MGVFLFLEMVIAHRSKYRGKKNWKLQRSPEVKIILGSSDCLHCCPHKRSMICSIIVLQYALFCFFFFFFSQTITSTFIKRGCKYNVGQALDGI